MPQVANLIEGDDQVVREVKLRQFEREKEACLVVLEDILEGLEDGLLDQMGSLSEQVPSHSDDPFLDAALSLLWRIDKLREAINGFPFMESDPSKTEWLEEQLTRLELLVRSTPLCSSSSSSVRH